MKPRGLFLSQGVLITAFLLATTARPADFSKLWGERGEEWNPRSRLPDFSFAGYHQGEKPIPNTPRAISVRDFGARGDGTADDTPAFEKALAAVTTGAIEIPPGRYRITRMLKIARPGIVLRGADPENTILYFPIALNDIQPNWGATTTGERTSNYSWSGGFITLRGSFRSRQLARITGSHRRGDTEIQVSTTQPFKPGQQIEIYQHDTPENTLAIHLYSGDAGPVQNLNGQTRTSLICRIDRVGNGRIHLNRPLRCDLESEWQPQVRAFQPTVTECGVENLTFEFPNAPYKGHFTELGFNAIALQEVAHCWVRHVRTKNAESGLFISGCFNTIQDVVLESQREHDRQDCVGHHGISLGGGDNLVTQFDIRTRYIHDITVSHHCAGNVISSGHGDDLSLDHHRYAPYENLFTDLDAGKGARLWKCGGGAALGKHCAMGGTFWNIRSENPLTYPPPQFGPETMNLVALQTTQPTETQSNGKWFEAIPPQEILPRNLHRAQLTRRLRSGQKPER